MKKLLATLAVLLLAGLLFGTAAAFSAAGPEAAAGAKPTKVPGQGRGLGRGQAKGACKFNAPAGTPGAPGTAPAKLNYVGAITALGASSLTLSTTVSGTVTVLVTEATCIKLPGVNHDAALADLSVGGRVNVHAISGASGPVAQRVQTIGGGGGNGNGGGGQKVERVGVVTAYSPGSSLTIETASGATVTFSLTAATQIRPKHRAGELAVGREVTIKLARGAAGANPVAARITVHGTEDD